MKKLYSLVILCLIFQFFILPNVFSQIRYQRTIGGPTAGETSYAITKTTDGGYAIAGETRSFGAGSFDMYVLKFDMNDSLQWSKTIGGSSHEVAYSIIQTSDGGFAVAGYTYSYGAGQGDMFIVKLNGNGDILWSKVVGGSGDEYAWNMIQTSDGGYALAGSSYGFGSGNDDAYIVKLSATGDLEWSKTYGGAGYEYANSIIQTSDGDFVIIGETNSFGAGGYDMLIFKISGNGDLLWSRTIGGGATEYGNSIIQASDGGYIAVGPTLTFSQGSYDFYIVKLDGNGNLQWTKTIGGTGSDNPKYIIKTIDNGYTICGWTQSFGAGTLGDFYLVKINENGDLLWNTRAGGSNQDVPFSMIQMNDESFIVTGYSGNGISGTTYDVYTVKFTGSGITCGNSANPTPVIGTGGVLGTPTLIVTNPASIISSVSPVSGSGGTVNDVCYLLSVNPLGNEIPESFNLFQNYPNPFNPETNIRFDIPNNVFVEIKIHDITGKEIATLVNEFMGSGSYIVTYDGSYLPSGIYFYTLRTESFSETKRMVLTK